MRRASGIPYATDVFLRRRAWALDRATSDVAKPPDGQARQQDLQNKGSCKKFVGRRHETQRAGLEHRLERCDGLAGLQHLLPSWRTKSQRTSLDNLRMDGAFKYLGLAGCES